MSTTCNCTDKKNVTYNLLRKLQVTVLPCYGQALEGPSGTVVTCLRKIELERVTGRVQKVRSGSRSETVVVSEVQYEVTLGTFQV